MLGKMHLNQINGVDTLKLGGQLIRTSGHVTVPTSSRQLDPRLFSFINQLVNNYRFIIGLSLTEYIVHISMTFYHASCKSFNFVNPSRLSYLFQR